MIGGWREVRVLVQTERWTANFSVPVLVEETGAGWRAYSMLHQRAWQGKTEEEVLTRVKVGLKILLGSFGETPDAGSGD